MFTEYEHNLSRAAQRHDISPIAQLALITLAALLAGGCSGSSGRDESAVEVRSVSEEAAAAGSARELTPAEAQADLRRGVAAVEQGNPDRAFRYLEPLAEHPEHGATASYVLGAASQLEGRPAEAVRYYRQSLDQDPSMVRALIALLRLRLAVGDVDGAQLDYHRTLAASQSDPAVRAAGLQIDLYRGDYEGVINDARDILLYEEGNIDAHLALAVAYHELGQTELAKLVIREALQRDPNRVDLWLTLANIQIQQENEVAAIQSLRELLAVDPLFVEAHNNLGVLLHRARNDIEAIDHLERAVDLRPDYVEAWLNLSNALKASGQLVEAERAIEQALALDPRLADAYFNLGLLYLDTDFPGMSRVERLQASVEQFNRYRSEMGPTLSRDDPVEAYINEALTAIEADQQLGTPGDDGGAFGDEEWEENELEEDEFEEDEWEDDEWEDDEWEDVD